MKKWDNKFRKYVAQRRMAAMGHPRPQVEEPRRRRPTSATRPPAQLLRDSSFRSKATSSPREREDCRSGPRVAAPLS